MSLFVQEGSGVFVDVSGANPTGHDLSGGFRIDHSGNRVNPPYKTIQVNLRNMIDASATVQLFGPSQEILENVVWCDVPLNHLGLFNGSVGVFQFWEPSGDRRTIYGAVNPSAAIRNNLLNTLRDSLQDVLTGNMDASGAYPFNNYKTNELYYKFSSFGELALAYTADDMFGHVAATAAIYNDQQIVNGFDASNSTDVSAVVVPTQDGQALAQRLCKALFDTTDSDATTIARFVIGQDARRARDQDNNEPVPNVRQALAFVPGDVVYMAITLKDFSVSASSPSGNNYVPVNTKPESVKYYLRIVLY